MGAPFGPRWLGLDLSPRRLRLVQPDAVTAVDLHDAGPATLAAALGGVLTDGTARPWSAGPHLLVAATAPTTEVERRALHDALLRAGAAVARFVPPSYAAGLGADLPIDRPAGSLVLHLGATASEVAVLSGGGIVTRRTLPIGGDDLDARLLAAVRKSFDALIRLPDATAAREQAATAAPGPRDVPVLLHGRALGTGAPVPILLSPDTVAQAWHDTLRRLAGLVLDVLRDLPPELCADLGASGLVLTGGLARLRGLDHVLRDAVDLPVLIADQPELAVARGLRRLITSAEARDAAPELSL